jgi:hypothetical protein
MSTDSANPIDINILQQREAPSSNITYDLKPTTKRLIQDRQTEERPPVETGDAGNAFVDGRKRNLGRRNNTKKIQSKTHKLGQMVWIFVQHPNFAFFQMITLFLLKFQQKDTSTLMLFIYTGFSDPDEQMRQRSQTTQAHI